MKALILAGGLGTRLRPLTYNLPKPLLPVANRAHIEHILDLLAAQETADVVLLTSYLAEAFDDVVRRAADRGIEVKIAVEEEPLGTAGAIKNGESFIEDEPFFVFNGDVLTDVDLGEMRRRHEEVGAQASILLTPVENPSAFGVVPTEDDGRVRGFIEKPEPGTAPTNEINAGVYLFEASMLERIPAGEVYSTEKALFPGMVEDDRDLFAWTIGSYWIDIGTPVNYLRANIDSLRGRFATTAADETDARGALIGQGAVVSEAAGLRSSCIGDGASVEAGAWVERSVLLPGARVEEGAEVRGCILGHDAVVTTSIEDLVVAAGEEKEIV